MANRELSVLGNLFRRCREWKLYDGDNHAERVKGTREPRTRLRYLELDEEARLLAEARDPLRTIVLAGIHAGLRVRSEALTLTWPNVDLVRGFLTVQAGFAKTGQTRTVPLNRTLRAALERLKRDARGDPVFTRPDGQPLRFLYHGFMAACQRAGLEGVSPHVAPAYLREPAGDGRRRPPDRAGARRLEVAGDGRAIQPPEPGARGRCRRADRHPTVAISHQGSQQPLAPLAVSRRRS